MIYLPFLSVGCGVSSAGADGERPRAATNLPASVADGERFAQAHASQVLPHGPSAAHHEVSSLPRHTPRLSLFIYVSL